MTFRNRQNRVNADGFIVNRPIKGLTRVFLGPFPDCTNFSKILRGVFTGYVGKRPLGGGVINEEATVVLPDGKVLFVVGVRGDYDLWMVVLGHFACEHGVVVWGYDHPDIVEVTDGSVANEGGRRVCIDDCELYWDRT